MARSGGERKLESVNLRVPADLKAAFQAAALSNDRPAAEVIRTLMEVYVEEHKPPEADHDSWFRVQVQEALDDGRAGVRHEDVMRRTRALLDRPGEQKT